MKKKKKKKTQNPNYKRKKKNERIDDYTKVLQICKGDPLKKTQAPSFTKSHESLSSLLSQGNLTNLPIKWTKKSSWGCCCWLSAVASAVPELHWNLSLHLELSIEICYENISSLINILFAWAADRPLNPPRRTGLIFWVGIFSATPQARPVIEAESSCIGRSAEHGGDMPSMDAKVEQEAHFLHCPPQAAEQWWFVVAFGHTHLGELNEGMDDWILKVGQMWMRRSLYIERQTLGGESRLKEAQAFDVEEVAR